MSLPGIVGPPCNSEDMDAFVLILALFMLLLGAFAGAAAPLAHAAPNREPRKYEARYQRNRNVADNRHQGSHFTQDTFAQVHKS